MKQANNFICGTFDLFSVIISESDPGNPALTLGVLLLQVQPVDFIGIHHASKIVWLCCLQNTVTYGFRVVAAGTQW